MKRTVGLAVLASILLAAACSRPTVPSPSASPVAPPSAVSVPSTSPGSTTAATPSEAALPVEWLRVPASPSFAGALVEAVVPLPSGFAAVGCATAADPCPQPAVWFSDDARAWEAPIGLPLADGESGGVAAAAAAGQRGIVVAGSVRREPGPNLESGIEAALWLSADGETFRRVPAQDSFGMAAVTAVEPVAEGFAAVGFGAFTEAAGFRAWWSPDGTAWSEVTPPGTGAAFALHLLPAGGELIAWGPSCSVCVAGTMWWSTGDGRTWRTDGAAPGLDGVDIGALIATPAGLLAAGSGVLPDGEPVHGMWQAAADRGEWSPTEPPAMPPDAAVELLLPVGDGVVAAATSHGGAVPATLVVGRAPGADRWHELAAITGLTPLAVLRQPADPRAVILVGRSGADGRGDVVTWLGGVDWSP